jgi:hypothetical protein
VKGLSTNTLLKYLIKYSFFDWDNEECNRNQLILGIPGEILKRYSLDRTFRVRPPQQLPHKLSPQVKVDLSLSQPRGLTVISYSRIPRTIFLLFFITLVASVVYQLICGL